MLQDGPSPPGFAGQQGLLANNVAIDDELDVLNRCDFGNCLHSHSNAMRPCSSFGDDAPGTFVIDFQQKQRPGGDEAPALRHTFEPGGEIGLLLAANVRLAVAELTASWIVARASAREAVADIEDVIPASKVNSPVHPKLKKL